MQIKPCLFDLDGTLADHTGALMRDLARIQSPGEPPIFRHDENEPEWAKERKRLIRSQRDWWFNLEPIKLGFDIYNMARLVGFQINVLTKGPWTCAHAWTEKVLWVRKYLHDDVKITISEDKSIVYGRVLVDDYIPYLSGWLQHRPRGVVVMPAHEENENWMWQIEKENSSKKEALLSAVAEGRFVRYDGTNLGEVELALVGAYQRN